MPPKPTELSVQPLDLHLSSVREADKLLELAEQYQDKCEAWERRRSFLLVVGLAFAIVVTGALIYFSINNPFSERPLSFLASAVTGVYGVVMGMQFYFIYKRIFRSYRRDRRALFAIVDMLRDLESNLVKEGKASPLERAEFRIRLSRFDIGPGY